MALRIYQQSEIEYLYGDIHRFIGPDGRISAGWEQAILEMFELPAPIPMAGGTGKAIHCSCHKLVAKDLKTILQEVHDAGLWFKDYGGCYQFRNQRNARQLSHHCWGVAIDLDPNENPMGQHGVMDPKIIDIFYNHDWVWGGNFRGSRRDPMHFEQGTTAP